MRVVSMIVLFVFLVPVVATAQNGPYPEYDHFVTVDTASCAHRPYFGPKSHYWLRIWNAPGYLTEEGNRVWDGILYDGQFMYRPNVSPKEGRVYFRLGFKDPLNRPEDHYFLPWEVVQDPRITNWWMSEVNWLKDKKPKTLFAAVQSAAISGGFPRVTWALIEHMVQCGIVSTDEFTKMTAERIHRVMVDYTNLALTENLEMTVALVGTDRLTRERFKTMRPGDVIESYFWSRFGPYPTVATRRVVKKVVSDTAVVIHVGGDREFELPLVQIESEGVVALRRKQ